MAVKKPVEVDPWPLVVSAMMLKKLPAFVGLRGGFTGVHCHMIDVVDGLVGQRRLIAVALAWESKWVNEDGSVNRTYSSSTCVSTYAACHTRGRSKIDGNNRVGVDLQLHRISSMRSKSGDVYGLTLRVGRMLKHASNCLLDMLLSAQHRSKSVLVLGRPGCGKTTLIRDIARCVSEHGENVCVIDTSNEIAGDGLVPHACIGWARRMIVKWLDDQARVMVECVQNHTVETLIVDKIGRKAEVNAAGTVKQRGPRVIASAHGDFRSLIKNRELRGLVGGVQSVVVGDGEAKRNSKTLGKVQARRAADPIFDIVVEIDDAMRGRCRIIWDVAQAVDDVLSGGREYPYETRFHTLGMCGVQVTRI